MIFQLIVEDNPSGVRLEVRGGHNDVTDHPASSLAAMWASKIYMMFEEANKKGHAKVFIDDTTNLIH